MSSLRSNSGPMPMTFWPIVEVRRHHRHVGGLARCARSRASSARPACACLPARARTRTGRRRGSVARRLFDHAVRRRCGRPGSRRAGAAAAPIGHQNSWSLPRTLMSRPIASFAAKPQIAVPVGRMRRADQHQRAACRGTRRPCASRRAAGCVRPSQRVKAIGLHPRRVRRQRQHVPGGRPDGRRIGPSLPCALSRAAGPSRAPRDRA